MELPASGVDVYRCEYCAEPLGTPERPCCEEWTPYSIGFYRSWQQAVDRWKERPPGHGDVVGWCCGRWLIHHAEVDAHLRDMHNVGGVR